MLGKRIGGRRMLVQCFKKFDFEEIGIPRGYLQWAVKCASLLEQ